MEFAIGRTNVAAGRVFTVWVGLLTACYLAVLPMAGTIALRSLTLVALLLSLTWHFRAIRFAGKWDLPIVLWVCYLLFFPVISDSPMAAIDSVVSQWGRGVLAMVVGAGVAAIFCRKELGSSFLLGLVSAFPILVHLVLFGWKALTTSSIPWGYWGRETHHADLGYAAGQAVVLLVVSIVAGHRKVGTVAFALVLACLASTALAQSRAGLVFCLIGAVLVGASAYLTQARHLQKHMLSGLVGVMFAASTVIFVALKEDVRWQNMVTHLVAGLEGDAIQIQCEGTISIEAAVISKYGQGEQAQRLISSVRDGDGSRVVLLRAGLDLALGNPMGSDGSKHAFQKLLAKRCEHPAIAMAHVHNGWIDTALALGWIGVVLYFSVLLHFFKLGYFYLRRTRQLNEWALVLATMSIFWISRSFTDSVFRDHMLEMQGFVLAYAAVALNLQAMSKNHQILPR
jgi:hypothetical protein